jgi:hypothetical protein
MAATDIFLDRIEPNGIVVGTNNADDIPLGTVFTQLTKIRVDQIGGTPTEVWSQTVDLRLVDVVIFRKSVETVPRGWSAGLRLEGMGMEAIADALSGKTKAEFIHLRAASAA